MEARQRSTRGSVGAQWVCQKKFPSDETPPPLHIRCRDFQWAMRSLPSRKLFVCLLLVAAAKLGGNAEVVGGDKAGSSRRNASGKAGTDVGSASSKGGRAHRARGEAEQSGGSHLGEWGRREVD